MKLKTIALIAGLLAPFALQAGEFRTFTSADGSKTMTAKLVDFDGKAITIKIDGGKQLTAPITAFSKEDAAYANAALEKMAAARNLAVNFEEAEDEPTSKTANTRKVTSRSEGFEVSFRNNGAEPIKGLTAEYQIFWTEDALKGASTDQVTAGSTDLSEIAPRDEIFFSTEKVSLVTDKLAPSNAP